jgi:hypothetical protein
LWLQLFLFLENDGLPQTLALGLPKISVMHTLSVSRTVVLGSTDRLLAFLVKGREVCPLQQSHDYCCAKAHHLGAEDSLLVGCMILPNHLASLLVQGHMNIDRIIPLSTGQRGYPELGGHVSPVK